RIADSGVVAGDGYRKMRARDGIIRRRARSARSAERAGARAFVFACHSLLSVRIAECDAAAGTIQSHRDRAHAECGDAVARLVALGRIRLMQGRSAEARDAEQRIRAIENVREWPIAPVARALLRGLIDDDEQALRLAVKLQNRIHIDYFAGDARVALAALLLR